MRYSTKKMTVGNLQPTVVLFGDWEKATLLINNLPTIIKAASIKGQRSAAMKFRRLIKSNIRNNGVPGVIWPDFSPDYRRIKSLQGFDGSSFYQRTGLYHRSIKVWRVNDNYYVGVKKGVKHPNSKGRFTVGQLAKLLEIGSAVAKIKPRPLWAPTFKQFKGDKRVKAHIIWHIRNMILVKYGIKAKVY